MFFHAIFVGGTLARQWRNQEKTVDFSRFSMGHLFFFHCNLVDGYPRKKTGKS